MDSDSGSIALLAIKPRFAEAIIAGKKKVEFRKTRFTQPPRYIVLYASTPVQQIVAYFEVAYIKELTPIGLWREFRKVGAIDYSEFSKYYGTRATGYAIVVGAVWKLSKPAALRNICPKSSVPQSFCYLQLDAISRLLRKRKSSH
jgi:predicted transcriptional regulator